MTDRMTNERIAELAAMQPGTPGLWHIHASERYGDRCTEYYHEVWDENLNVICEEVTRAHNDGGSKNMRLIAAAPEAFDALRQTRADLAQAEATIAERDAEIERLRAVLERIETASRHWADYNAAPDAVHYAHESTARLARAALKETEHD